MTGVTPALLRAWEQRFGLFKPSRSGGGFRLYDDADLQILLRIRELARAGRTIGEIARIGRRALLAQGRAQEGPGRMSDTPGAAVVRPPAPSAHAALERLGVVLAEVADPTPPSGIVTISDHAVLRSFPDAAIASDITGRISYANVTAERLLGWPVADLVGKPLASIIPPRLRAAHQAGFERFVSTRIPMLMGRTVRVPALRVDGREVEVDLTLTCVPIAGGEMFVASLREVREPVALETGASLLEARREVVRALERNAVGRGASEILSMVADALARDFCAALARVWSLEPGGDRLRMRASAGLSRRTADSPRGLIDLRTYRFKVGFVARSGLPFARNGIQGDPDFEPAWVDRERLEAAVVLPLLHDRRLHGVLAAFFRRRIDPAEIQIIDLLARLAAAALAGEARQSTSPPGLPAAATGG